MKLGAGFRTKYPWFVYGPDCLSTLVLRDVSILQSATRERTDDDVERSERDDAADDRQAVLEDERLKQRGQSVRHFTRSVSAILHEVSPCNTARGQQI